MAPGIKGLKPYYNVIVYFFPVKKLLYNEIKNLCRKKKFEKCVKDKNKFFIKQLSRTFLSFFKQKYISFLEMYFLKIPKNLIASTFFLWRLILNNIYMPQQKPQHLPTAKANFERWKCGHNSLS